MKKHQQVDEAGKRLVVGAYECLMTAIEMVKPGVMFRDLGLSLIYPYGDTCSAT